MTSNSLRIKTIIGTFVGLVLSAIIIILVTSNSGSRTNSPDLEYAPNSKTNNAGPVVLKYRQNIDQSKGSLVISPTPQGEIQIIDEYVIFWPQRGLGFTNETEYSVTSSGFMYLDGTLLPSETFTFYVDPNEVYHPLQLDVFQKYDEAEENTAPFLGLLPYEKQYEYRISYSPADIEDRDELTPYNSLFVIEILVYQSRFDTIEDHIANVQNARQDALEWIRSNDIDPDDIEYVFSPTDRQLGI